ncbi:tRNA1(Val) (adenine(37)-N6)-methyltransferase [Devosia sp.]|uniref:tRNA1(Val) (adenine(37)-N6)-methyltransferase n=1 Tax=Devosia sp. TaxID=1871048 RepID=UPI003A9265B9
MSQPRHGFRAGLDSVLLGAAVSSDSGQLLDLGAGVGTATLVALADRAGLAATLVESNPEALDLATQNLAENGFGDRAGVLALDLTAPGSARVAAGLPTDHFSTVIANPPFFEPARGTAPRADRQAARHMDAVALERWVRSAASHAAPGGEVIFIHTASALPQLLAGFTNRFGAICVLPLVPHAGADATRVLVRGIKGSRAPFRLLDARTLHRDEGRDFVPEFDAIFRGTGRLVW